MVTISNDIIYIEQYTATRNRVLEINTYTGTCVWWDGVLKSGEAYKHKTYFIDSNDVNSQPATVSEVINGLASAIVALNERMQNSL